MIPICDVRGKVIAFGGRVLDDSKPNMAFGNSDYYDEKEYMQSLDTVIKIILDHYNRKERTLITIWQSSEKITTQAPNTSLFRDKIKDYIRGRIQDVITDPHIEHYFDVIYYGENKCKSCNDYRDFSSKYGIDIDKLLKIFKNPSINNMGKIAKASNATNDVQVVFGLGQAKSRAKRNERNRHREQNSFLHRFFHILLLCIRIAFTSQTVRQSCFYRPPHRPPPCLLKNKAVDKPRTTSYRLCHRQVLK